jgi:hypothetical protein
MSEEVSCRIVGIFSLESISFRSAKSLVARIGLKVELHPEGLSLGIDPFESVGAITVHVSETIGGSSIREKDGHLMN